MRLALVVGLLLASAATAHAYPQWQFSSGTNKCSSCHLSPSGGGLLSGYGRDQVGEELSTFEGDGGLLHGVGSSLPGWLSLGGDLRGAFVVNDVGDPSGAKVAAFPMQAELGARLGLPGGWSIAGTLGMRGQVRDSEDIVPDQNYQPVSYSQLISREHFVMWKPGSRGIYAKLGRYFAPFGLRLPEHIFYVRRDLGFNLMEESYNLSVGWLGEASELHVSAFAPDELRHMGGTEWGGAAYYEHHMFDSTGALGAQAKIGHGVGVTRWITGGVAKKYVPTLKTLFLAETNLVYNNFHDDSVGSTFQLVGIAGASYLPVRGLILSLFGERSQTDLRVTNSSLDAGSLQLTWFPYAHIELQLLGRLQFPSGGELAKTLFFQVHYFL